MTYDLSVTLTWRCCDKPNLPKKDTFNQATRSWKRTVDEIRGNPYSWFSCDIVIFQK